MQHSYNTARLSLNKLTLSDAAFINELLNTPEWIQFIGNRNINGDNEAVEYIRKIMDNPNISYWVVTLNVTKMSIGIITFIKRTYLAHHDIGFAFLSKYTQKGYAYEAALTILNNAIEEAKHSHILATTVKENYNSIKLLEKLGLRFTNEIEFEGETLLVYSIAANAI